MADNVTLTPVDYDPFGENPSAPQLVPVDHDPDQAPAHTLVPVDHDPFTAPIAPGSPQAAAMTHTGDTRPPLGRGAQATLNMMRLPVDIATGLATTPQRFIEAGRGLMDPQANGPMTDWDSPEDRAIKASMDAAMLTSTGGIAGVPGSPGAVLGVFAGKGAKTANLAALANAERMAAAGAYPDDIIKATGWFQGADKQWRFEIPDYTAQLRHGVFPKTLGEKLDHPDLFEAYPDLAGGRMDYGSKPGNAYYQQPNQFNRETFGVSPVATTPEALHEVQHAIQVREGFSPGSSPAAEMPAVQAVATKAPSDVIKLLAAQNYKRAAGEVEARNVMKRSTMTPEELSDVPPWYTQDVQNQFQRVGGKTVGPAASEPVEPQMGDNAGAGEDQMGAGRFPSHKVQRQNFADAYKQGQDDYHAGVTRNPYPLGSKEHLVWWDARNSLQQYYEHGSGQFQGENFAEGLQQFGVHADEGEAARQARAQEQGFTTPAYRGTTQPPRQVPKTGFGQAYAAWSSDSPELASQYASGGSTEPLQEGARVFGVQGQRWTPLNPQVQPLLLDTSNYHVVDAGGRGINEVRAAALHDAHLRNKPGLIIKNVYDEPGEGGGTAAGSVLRKPTTVYATFDPSTRRGRFARFDPTKRGSPDLLAGLAPFGVGAVGAGTVSSRPQPSQ